MQKLSKTHGGRVGLSVALLFFLNLTMGISVKKA